MRRLVIFLTAYATWLLLVFPYDAGLRVKAGLPAWDVQSIVFGLGVAAFCAIILPTGLTNAFSLKMLNPVRWFWAAIYVFVLAYEILKANLQVAYIVIHPDLPIRPGVVRVRTGLKTTMARVLLANSITLTPGTFTLDLDDEEGVLYVHWLVVEAEGEEEASKIIVARFEPILRRVFE
jgi:multicomponent Na+:H+ antiporter subunit E